MIHRASHVLDTRPCTVSMMQYFYHVLVIALKYGEILMKTISSQNFPKQKSHELSVMLRWSIFVMWLGCRFLDTEVEGSNPGSIIMLCP